MTARTTHALITDLADAADECRHSARLNRPPTDYQLRQWAVLFTAAAARISWLTDD